jgi:tRNA pseudouridine38-40 synthase
MSVEKNGNNLIFTVVGKSFLWNMVRKMITAILKIARGEFEVEVINELFKPIEQRPYIRLTPAPAKGLILSDMQYKNIKFKEYDYAKEKLVKVLYEQCLSYEHYKQEDNVLIKLLSED